MSKSLQSPLIRLQLELTPEPFYVTTCSSVLLPGFPLNDNAASARALFRVVALGSVSVSCADAKKPGALSQMKQRLLAALVAAGPLGATTDALIEAIWEEPGTAAALRMAVARLRDHLSPEALPDAVDGRYRLNMPVGDVDVWRLHDLAANGVAGPVPVGELSHILNPRDAYAGIDSELVDDSIRALRHNQRTLIDRLAAERPALLQGEFLTHLRDHLAIDEYNENLVALVVTATAKAGDRRQALAILRDAQERFVEEGLALTPAVARLELELLDGEGFAPAVEVVRTVPILPLALREAGAAEYVGDGRQVLQLLDALPSSTDTATAIVAGRSGAGKTRLCAEVGRLAVDRGARVVYVAGSPTADTAFGPFLAALPELRSRVVELYSAAVDSEARRAGVWFAACESLGRAAAGRPLLLLLDDCQWFDSQSVELIEFLARTTFDVPALLVACGRDDEPTNSSWGAVRQTLRRAGSVADLAIEPFDESAVADLMTRLRVDLPPDAPRQDGDEDPSAVAPGVAAVLHRLTGGLPGLVTVVLKGLSGDLTGFNASSPPAPDQLLDHVIAALSPSARELGSVAAIIGPGFELSQVAGLTGFAEPDLLVTVDELIRGSLVFERDANSFALVHLLVQEAFDRQLPQPTRLELHEKAAKLFVGDRHRRAYHLAAAADRVGVMVAVDALAESAEHLMAGGLFREAVAEFQAAVVLLDGEPFAPARAGRFARALDLARQPTAARRVRADAVDRALAADRHDEALRIAIGGLPEAEPVDGETSLVDALLRLDADRLEPGDQHRLACELARQLAILGRLEESAEASARAALLARTATETFESAVAARFAVSAASDPTARLRLLEPVQVEQDALEAENQATLQILLAIDRYEAGDKAGAAEARRAIHQLVPSIAPLRQWHALLFDALWHADHGDTHAAQQSRAHAFEFGSRCGIFEAENAQFAPMFCDLWVRGAHASLAPMLETDGLLAEGSVLGQSALGSILDRVGQTAAAVATVERLARQVLDAPASQGTAALAVSASVLAKSSDVGLIDQVHELLAARGDSILVVGACVASLGPVARYRAMLARDEVVRVRLLHEAIELADRADLALWRVATRRDLLAIGGEVPDADVIASLANRLDFEDYARPA